MWGVEIKKSRKTAKGDLNELWSRAYAHCLPNGALLLLHGGWLAAVLNSHRVESHELGLLELLALDKVAAQGGRHLSHHTRVVLNHELKTDTGFFPQKRCHDLDGQASTNKKAKERKKERKKEHLFSQQSRYHILQNCLMSHSLYRVYEYIPLLADLLSCKQIYCALGK